MIEVSRQGNLAVINHPKFQIHFNLAKGTWDYIDETGQTIIKNGRTQITLQDGRTVSTEDAGVRQFITEPMPVEKPASRNTAANVVSGFDNEQPRGTGPRATAGTVALEDVAPTQKIRFSHETDEKGIRLNTYLHCVPDEPHIVLKVGIENLGRVPVALDSVTLLGISTNRGAVQLGGQPSGYHLFLNTPPAFPGGGIQRLYNGFQRNESEANRPCQSGILHDTDSQRALVFGFLTTEKWWPQVQIGHQAMRKESPGINRWALSHRCERQRCKTGEEVTTESLYLNFADGAEAAYRHYTELVAAQHGAQTTTQLVSGWHLLDLASAGSEEAAAQTYLEQTDLLAESPLFRPQYPGGITYLQLDIDIDSDSDATQAEVQNIVHHIHAKGFKAAIRINPFSIARDAELLQRHPDCRLQRRRTSSRDTEQEDVALLDVSHPKAQAHIRQQLQQIIAEWGCELIQADFSAYTTALTSPHNVTWRDSSLTSVQLYRLAVQVVKDAVAEATAPQRTEVLLTAYNLVPGLGIGNFAMNCPMAAVGPRGTDTVNWHHQNGTKHRISQSALHHSEHNTLWSHVFGELKIDEPRPINEAIVELTAAAFSGGGVFCADALTTLKPHRAELLAKLFPLLGTAAKPLTLYDEPFPRIWHLAVPEAPPDLQLRQFDRAADAAQQSSNMTTTLVAVFNWQDHEDDADFELGALGLSKSKDYLVHDFWMRQYLGTVSESLTLLNIPSRSVKLLCLREEQDVPQLLATDMHWTQGSVEILSAGWDSKSESYLLVCRPPRQAEGTCFIHVPDGYLPIGVSAYGSEYRYRWHAPICQVMFRPTAQLIHACVRFVRTSG